jgi:hypothetical protein
VVLADNAVWHPVAHLLAHRSIDLSGEEPWDVRNLIKRLGKWVSGLLVFIAEPDDWTAMDCHHDGTRPMCLTCTSAYIHMP